MRQQALGEPARATTLAQRSGQLATAAIFLALACYQFGNDFVRYLLMLFTVVGGLTFLLRSLKTRQLDFDQREYTFAAIVAWFFLSALISWLLNPTDIALTRVKQFLLWSAWGGGILLILHYYIPQGFSQRLFCIGLAISGLLTGIASIYLYYYVDDDARVAIGPNFPTIFGGIAVFNGILCLYFALREHASRLLRLALNAGLAGTLLTAYASGARGAWLCLLVMFPVVVFTTPGLRPWIKILLVSSIIGGAASVAFVSDDVARRMNLIETEVNDYFVRDKEFSSIGLRLDSWEACIITFMRHPLVGVGDDLLGESFAPLIADGTTTPIIKPFDHVHNDLLQFAHAKGLMGLIAYFGLLALPLLIAAPRWRQLAMFVSLSYFIFGITDVFFKIESPVVYYFFISLLLMNLREETARDPS